MTCTDCGHAIHAGRCFHVENIGPRAIACNCKRRAEPATVKQLDIHGRAHDTFLRENERDEEQLPLL